MECPTTPLASTSSSAMWQSSPSSSSSAFGPQTPTSSSSARRIVNDASGSRRTFRYSTPPTSPPPHATPSSHRTPSKRTTLHLVSPAKPSPRFVAPLPTTSPQRRPFTVKGNVTPSRASAFFAPRSNARRARPLDSSSPSSSNHHVPPSPSAFGHTSARRGAKRMRSGRSAAGLTSATSSDRITLGKSSSARPLFMAPDSDDSDSQVPGGRRLGFDSESDEDGEDDLYDLTIRPSRSLRAPSPSLASSFRTPSSRPMAALPSLSGSTVSPSPPPKPLPAALRTQRGGATLDLASALSKMRCGAGSVGLIGGLTSTAAIRRRIPQTSCLSTFTSHPSLGVYTMPSTDALCASYSYSAKSYGATRQWLAVGDLDGKLSLIDTARDITLDDFDMDHGYSHGDEAANSRPSWQVVNGGPLFSLAWRYDDRYIAASGGDFQVKIFDTSTAQQVHTFDGFKGTARSIQWDPSSQGQLLAGAGRDGGVHVWDLRMSSRQLGSNAEDDDEQLDIDPMPPLLSLWSAHSSSRARSTKTRLIPRGVTSLVYHPQREHCIFSTGCADASIRGWDLRFAVRDKASEEKKATAATSSSSSPRVGVLPPYSSHTRPPFRDVSNHADRAAPPASKRKTRKPRKVRPGEASFVLHRGDEDDEEDPEDAVGHGTDDPVALGQDAAHPVPIAPCAQTDDLSLTLGRHWNKRSHGISSLCISGGHQQRMYAACTDGRIYQTPLSSLEPGQGAQLTESLPPLFHSAQLGNSLQTPLSLCPDDRTLAVGCNNGNVLLWDTDTQKASILGASSDPSSRHLVNCEINALDWCYDASVAGWRLATASDDATIRVWEADRGLARVNGEGEW